MKRILFPSLLLIVLLALAACGSSPAAPTAVVEVAPTAAPTEPPPTDPPPTPTAQPTATAEPTATPARTEAVCDIERAREAAENIGLFDSYTLDMTGYMQLPNEQVRQRLLTVESAVALSGGQVTAMEMTFDSLTDAAPFQLILVDDLLYFRPAGEPWQVATALVSDLMATQVSSGLAIDATVLEVLLDYPCAPFSERIDGRDAAGYRFTEVDLAEVAAVTASVANLGDLPTGSLQSSEFLIWVAEVEDAPVMVKWQINIIFDVGEGEALVETMSQVGGFNEPVDIRAPQDVAAVAFPLDVPRPDDAQIYLEDAATLAFFTGGAPEEMKAFYTDVLTADGWTAGETSKQTVDGRNVEVQRFSRGEEQLEMAIAVTEGDTIVAFSLADEE